ncbi:hypothetical protein NLG97_g7483 [Lecanicillium saksenae]|uniref:Uncharacterized protein n=1 Tax=Lecanicillium saksenae TaxID=468837 RepID=A0ACC1QQJ1_9HYPO|nr:hypothetical protein NLG97_g7483 [Lecanicillium saksenae]
MIGRAGSERVGNAAGTKEWGRERAATLAEETAWAARRCSEGRARDETALIWDGSLSLTPGPLLGREEKIQMGWGILSQHAGVLAPSMLTIPMDDSDGKQTTRQAATGRVMSEGGRTGQTGLWQREPLVLIQVRHAATLGMTPHASVFSSLDQELRLMGLGATAGHCFSDRAAGDLNHVAHDGAAVLESRNWGLAGWHACAGWSPRLIRMGNRFITTERRAGRLPTR